MYAENKIENLFLIVHGFFVSPLKRQQIPGRWNLIFTGLLTALPKLYFRNAENACLMMSASV